MLVCGAGQPGGAGVELQVLGPGGERGAVQVILPRCAGMGARTGQAWRALRRVGAAAGVCGLGGLARGLV